MNKRFTPIKKDSPEFEELLKVTYQGYYWHSNSTHPKVLEDEPIPEDLLTKMPFIVEANFYSKTTNKSVQIKHFDGQYRIAVIDLQGLDLEAKDEDAYDVVSYFAHRVGHDKYRVVEAWREVPLSVGKEDKMTTLEPAWTAFCGFYKE